ncbi:MAG: IucA/IucC family siderophore biosynthesis protein [Myxococcales bacterium]
MEFNLQLGMTSALLPVYLQEISATLYAAAYKHERQVLSAADLVHADFQEIETSMAEGHPCFVANSGRVGFDADDYIAFAPEAGTDIRIVWLAAHRQHTQFTSSSDLSYERLLLEELGPDTLADFAQRLTGLGLVASDYVYVPVHPWQWFNKLVFLFATDLAKRDLVCLGYGEDRYRAQQSIRTLFNLSHPRKRYVKMALSVLNMGFMRGLSADYMRATPAINDWVHQVVENDPCFAELGFGILREEAAVGYRSPLLQAAVPSASPYRKMLAALWRESPTQLLGPGRRLMTMAALLHRDRDGRALLPQLIKASGVDVDAWLAAYLRCYLAPLLHCLYRYELAFMPHGENIILLLEENLPIKALLKDIAEEAVVMDPEAELPPEVARLRAPVPEDVKVLSIFTDVFDCFFRYLVQILLEEAGYPEDRFWERVADCIRVYQASHPELAAKFQRYDVFAATFQRSCLNRLQLRNNRQLIDLTDPAKNLQFVGTLANPVAS